MRLGINTFLFACPFTNRDALLFPKFRQWGYDSVELAIASPSDANPAYLREQLDKNHLVAGSICAAMGPGRDLRGKPAEQKNSIRYLRDVIDQMDVLGCKVLAGPLYSTVGRADAETPAAKSQQWKLVKRHLRELSAYAGDRGVTLCIEPLNRFETDFINTCEQALDMVADVDHPALKVHLDTFHMNIEEKDLGQAIRRCGKHLGHFHASGSDRGTPGNDHINWQPIASALKAVKYEGDVVVESFTTDVKVIARAAAIWRRIEPTRDEIASKGARFLRRALNPPVSLAAMRVNKA